MRRLRTPFLLFLGSVSVAGVVCLTHTSVARSCPQMKPGTACTQDHSPVVCDGCPYGNLCQAVGAGFKAGRCVPEGNRSGATCPPPSRNVACTNSYKPVTCNGCPYSNACLASAAGFSSNRCIPAAVEEGKKPCPEPKPDVVCSAEYAPVVCDGCRYSNACVAGAAGLTKDQCAPAPE